MLNKLTITTSFEVQYHVKKINNVPGYERVDPITNYLSSIEKDLTLGVYENGMQAEKNKYYLIEEIESGNILFPTTDTPYQVLVYGDINSITDAKIYLPTYDTSGDPTIIVTADVTGQQFFTVPVNPETQTLTFNTDNPSFYLIII